MRKTIAAIATPPGTGGLSVIRISGPDAIARAAEIFKPMGYDKVKYMSGYTCAYGRVFDEEGKVLDDCVLTVFRAPHSYTGEDVAEISCHGGRYLTEQILRLVICDRVRPAEPGEFTKRAFLNGKMTLTQAEAVQDIISASGTAALRCARNLREGATFRRIRKIIEKLMAVNTELSVWTDYPDEDFVKMNRWGLQGEITGIMEDMQALLDTYDSGRVLREGVRCAIIGKPNVGKSTLFNTLAGFDRSIVTDIAGTTRDVVEEQVRLGSVTLLLSDTAGMRDTDDPVERLGVERSKKSLQDADLVLYVIDEPRKFPLHLDPKHTIVVLNKSDLADLPDVPGFTCIHTCAATGEGCRLLEAAIERFAANLAPSPEEGIIANERQHDCLVRALVDLRDAEGALEVGMSYDIASVSLSAATQQLMELTGERVTDRVVAAVFSRFCVGK